MSESDNQSDLGIEIERGVTYASLASFCANVGNLLSQRSLGFFLMITSAGNSVAVSIADDGKGGWVGFLLFFLR